VGAFRTSADSLGGTDVYASLVAVAVVGQTRVDCIADVSVSKVEAFFTAAGIEDRRFCVGTSSVDGIAISNACSAFVLIDAARKYRTRTRIKIGIQIGRIGDDRPARTTAESTRRSDIARILAIAASESRRSRKKKFRVAIVVRDTGIVNRIVYAEDHHL